MSSKKQAFENSLQYFENELAANVIVDKYYVRSKTDRETFLEDNPEQLLKRLRDEFKRVDSSLSDEDLEKINFDYIVPQGSVLYGLGNNETLSSLSNCVVVESPGDSMSSIMDTAKDLANLFKRRAGVGLDLSKLRPEGSLVGNSAGSSTGAWSFADLYSNVTRMVGQSARRGAIMVVLDVKHPDIKNFITCKLDQTKVTGANISIKISNEFMKAVENNENFDLCFPVDSNNVFETVSARDLWNLIVNTNRVSAEPGLLFWDTILENLPAEQYSEFKTICTNPCVSGDTWIETSNGPRQVKDLLHKPFEVTFDNKNYKSCGFWNNGKKEVYLITTDAGFAVKCTAEHKIFANEELKKVSDLKIGDKLYINNNQYSWEGEGTFEEGWFVGEIVGDGYYTKNSGASLAFWGESREDMLSLCSEYNEKNEYTHRKDLKGIRGKIYNKYCPKYLEDICEKYIEINSKNFKPTLELASSEFCKGLLRGLFDADGSVQGNLEKGISIRCAQINLYNLQIVQRILNRFGIFCKIYMNRKLESEREMPDGKGGKKLYNCKRIHELVISKDDMNRYSKEIGFNEPEKNNKLKLLLESRKENYKTKFVTNIQNIEKLPEEEVYDCKVEEINKFSANGIIVSNCSEISLSAYDSCRLISLNLSNFVENEFESNCKFNYSLFEKCVRIMTRLGDDLVDLEIEKLQQIINKTDEQSEKELWTKLLDNGFKGRRIGLGSHGLADVFAKMCIKYDSEPALDLAKNIFELFRNTAYDESCNLAIERGSFPAFDAEKHLNSNFIKRLPQEIINKISKTGIRNISILTQAPTGSIGILSLVSSGIEPVFANSHTRRKKKNHDSIPAETDFVDQSGDRWEEFKVIHPNVQNYLKKHKTDILPDYFVEAHNIEWDYRVKLQGEIQKYIDHSISSTINLPSTATNEIISEIYLNAWKRGLKGITVYVDGSRTGVLVKKPESPFVQKDAPKRPKELECDIHTVTIKGEKYTIFVGLWDGLPYEVMGGKSEYVEIPEKFTKAKIIKFNKQNSRYDLIVDDIRINNLTKIFENKNYEVLTRMLSLSLRHGASPNFLVEQLQKDPESDFFSFSRGIARVLKKYIKDGTKVATDKFCSNCNADGLKYVEGCATCSFCGYSKCN